MITFKLVQYGKSPQQVTRDIQKKSADIVASLITLAGQTRDLMRSTISTSSKFSGGILGNKIDVETTPSIGGGVNIGIGNISILMKEAPYWWVLNYGTLYGTGIQYVPGRKISDPTTPKFIPGYWQGNRFVYAPFSGTGMVPKNPITPVNYIELAVNFMDSNLRRI
jgi:hypothetical protein